MIALPQNFPEDDFDRNDSCQPFGCWTDFDDESIELSLIQCNCEICQLCRAEYDIEISE